MSRDDLPLNKQMKSNQQNLDVLSKGSGIIMKKDPFDTQSKPSKPSNIKHSVPKHELETTSVSSTFRSNSYQLNYDKSMHSNETTKQAESMDNQSHNNKPSITSEDSQSSQKLETVAFVTQK